MAGTVLISPGSAVAMRSFDFMAIAEQIRAQFSDQDRVITKRIYEPLDDEGMDFISLWEADNTVFACFVRAAERARGLVESGDPALMRKDVWNELFRALEADPRFPGHANGLSQAT